VPGGIWKVQMSTLQAGFMLCFLCQAT